MYLDKMSASSYQCYESCPFKFYLNYDLKIPSGSNASATVGHICHKVLEVLGRMKSHKDKFVDIDYLWRICYDHYMEESGLGVLKQADIQKGLDSIDFVVDSEYSPLKSNTLEFEKYFTIEPEGKKWLVKNLRGELKGLRINGIIDRIDQPNDDIIEVVDYKTGTTKNFATGKDKNINDFYNDIQARIYHLAATIAYPSAKEIWCTFIYAKEQKIFSIPFVKKDIDKTLDILHRRLITIKADKSPRRNTGWQCKNFCFYGGKTGICNKVYKDFCAYGDNYCQAMYYNKKGR